MEYWRCWGYLAVKKRTGIMGVDLESVLRELAVELFYLIG